MLNLMAYKTGHLFIWASSQAYSIRLQEIPICDRTIAQRTQLLRRITVMRPVSHLPLALRVDPLVVEHEHEKCKDTGADEAELEGVS